MRGGVLAGPVVGIRGVSIFKPGKAPQSSAAPRTIAGIPAITSGSIKLLSWASALSRVEVIRRIEAFPIEAFLPT